MISIHKKKILCTVKTHRYFLDTLSIHKMFWQFSKVISVLAQHASTHFQHMLSTRRKLLSAHSDFVNNLLVELSKRKKYKMVNISLNLQNKFVFQSLILLPRYDLFMQKNKRSKSHTFAPETYPRKTAAKRTNILASTKVQYS